MGIQTFDTANVYSNGQSEIILGKAIKQFNLPREEIVVMTKVRPLPKPRLKQSTLIMMVHSFMLQSEGLLLKSTPEGGRQKK